MVVEDHHIVLISGHIRYPSQEIMHESFDYREITYYLNLLQRKKEASISCSIY